MYYRAMKRLFPWPVPGLSFASILLVGCVASQQAPAPVTLYGSTEGEGSAGVHTVVSGENLWSISNRYNVVMRDIVVSNSLHAPFVLEPGQRIKLPPPRTYKVRAGDSLYTVSRLFEVNSSELARMNNLPAPYTLHPGQVLKLPSVTPRTMPAVMKTASMGAAVPPPVVERAAPVPAVSGGQAVPPMPGTKPPQAAPRAEPQATVQKASVTTKAKIPTQTPPRASSKFMRPVSGKVISTYGSKSDGLHNDGINILASRGAPVKAADNGVVVYAGDELKGSGNLILVRHADRWMTAYAHLDKINIKRGDVIKRGQVIGTVGSSGYVDRPQLHFEVRRGTEAINPERYLDS